MGIARGLIPSSRYFDTRIGKSGPADLRERIETDHQPFGHAVEIRDFVKSAPLAFLGALPVAGVKEGELMCFAARSPP